MAQRAGGGIGGVKFRRAQSVLRNLFDRSDARAAELIVVQRFQRGRGHVRIGKQNRLEILAQRGFDGGDKRRIGDLDERGEGTQHRGLEEFGTIQAVQHRLGAFGQAFALRVQLAQDLQLGLEAGRFVAGLGVSRLDFLQALLRGAQFRFGRGQFGPAGLDRAGRLAHGPPGLFEPGRRHVARREEGGEFGRQSLVLARGRLLTGLGAREFGAEKLQLALASDDCLRRALDGGLGLVAPSAQNLQRGMFLIDASLLGLQQIR